MSRKSDEWLIAEWKRRPYTGIDKRHRVVEHRVLADNVPGVGVDVRHEVRSPDAGQDDWRPIEVWEFRDHGVEKRSAGAWKEMPGAGGRR